MDGFDEKLQKLLNDPQALARVAQLAQGLQSPQSESVAEVETEPAAPPAVGSGAPGGLESLGGLGELLSGLDPKLLGGIMELAGEFGKKDDRRIALLNALRPYVRAERSAKMDRAAELVQLARVIRRGLGLLGGGNYHV